MKKYLVHFHPIEVSESEADELNLPDPNGFRFDREMEIIKSNCPTRLVFSKNKREPFPLISSVTKK